MKISIKYRWSQVLKLRFLLFPVLFWVTSSCMYSVGTMDKKVLIIYLSRTENTEIVAEMIQNEVGGDLVALELETPYPKDYQAIVDQVAKENKTGFLPELKTKINTDNYDFIYVGFPTWGMQLPPPVKSFLSTNNLKGKTVIPFNTNAGYGVGSSFETVKKLCADSNILKGFSVQGGIERDGVLLAIKDDRATEVENEVEQWLEEIGQKE